MLISSFLDSNTQGNEDHPEVRVNFVSREMETPTPFASSILSSIIGKVDDLVHSRDFCNEASKLYSEKPEAYEVSALADSFCKLAPEAVSDLIKFMHSYISARSSYDGHAIMDMIDQDLTAFGLLEMKDQDGEQGEDGDPDYECDSEPLFDTEPDEDTYDCDCNSCDCEHDQIGSMPTVNLTSVEG